MNGSSSERQASGRPPDVPHNVLHRYYRQESERQAFLRDIFDRTAYSYDWTEWLIGFGSGRWYRCQALHRAGLAPGMRVVDVGIGTGLLAREAIGIIGRPELLTGVDPSAGMIGHAQLPRGVALVRARAEALPNKVHSADFVSMGFALRHVSSLTQTCAEFYRVLRPGGRICLLEITPPGQPLARAALRAYMTTMVPTLAWLKTQDPQTRRIWTYYWETIEACVAPEAVLQHLRDAGFHDVKRHVELGMFSEYTACKPKVASGC
jgi:demethylmenaquinone methyltransferase/2-methoxy-6-polyprenyl-1,4-benzoquinol methylase